MKYCNTPVRGRVFKRGGWWWFETRVGDQVVLCDNTGNWRASFDYCLSEIHGVRALVRNNVRLPDHFMAVRG